MKTKTVSRAHVAGTFEFSHYWRHWSEVVSVDGLTAGYSQIVTVRVLTGPDAGRVVTHSTMLDPRDKVTSNRAEVL